MLTFWTDLCGSWVKLARSWQRWSGKPWVSNLREYSSFSEFISIESIEFVENYFCLFWKWKLLKIVVYKFYRFCGSYRIHLGKTPSLNYSETYFELDSEEATHCHHCYLICCVYIKGYVGTVDTKRSKQCYCVLSRVSCLSTLLTRRSKQAMHLMLCLSTLSTLVFVALTQHLMQVWKCCIKWPLPPAKREGYLWAFRLGV